jgi:hypothetical protein
VEGLSTAQRPAFARYIFCLCQFSDGGFCFWFEMINYQFSTINFQGKECIIIPSRHPLVQRLIAHDLTGYYTTELLSSP